MASNNWDSSVHPSHVQPKPKRNFFFPKLYPFPIFRDGPEGKLPWTCVVGHIKHQCVEVTDEKNIRLLFTQGFFGKGTLSRSTPKFLEKALKEEHRRKSSQKINVTITIDVQDGHAGKKVANSTDNKIKVEIAKQNPAKRRKRDEIEVVLSESESDDSSDDTSQKENLQLSLEEAYFLSYALGVLVVMDKDQPLDLVRLWLKFCEIHPGRNFPAMYTAYHHFRSKGWVVRSGLKYGADFTLYKDGPPFYHSSYAVIVRTVKQQNRRDIPGSRSLTCASLSGIMRMCSHVSKEVLILYVIKPTSMSDYKISTPHCISQFKLEEVTVNRWVPSSSRI